MNRIGVDLGGTKIEAVVLSGDRYDELFRERVPTPKGDYDGTVAAIAGLVARAQTFGEATVGVGTPGALNDSGVIKNANSTVLIGRPLKADIEAALGQPVRMENDANCFLRSEVIDGAATGSDTTLGVILGTGVGGALAVGHHVLNGANSIAGEWGHNPLPWPRGNEESPGPACYCGKHGCIETLLNGAAFARVDMQTYADRLARGLAAVINAFDPHTIVLGGGVSNVNEIYELLPQMLSTYVFSDTVRTRVVKAQHGDSSGVRGAAMLWS